MGGGRVGDKTPLRAEVRGSENIIQTLQKILCLAKRVLSRYTRDDGSHGLRLREEGEGIRPKLQLKARMPSKSNRYFLLYAPRPSMP